MHKSPTARPIARIAALAISLCCALSASAAQYEDVNPSPLAIGVAAGSAGFGPDAILTISPNFTFNLGYTVLKYDYDYNSNKARYSARVELNNIQGIINWHPFSGTFHLSAGAFSANNKAHIVEKPKADNMFDIGGTSYNSDQVGKITGDLKLSKGVVPYVGLGWAKSPLKSGFGFFADIGVMLTSAPKVTLQVSGLLANDPTFVSNLQKEESDLNKDLEVAKYYPVVQAGVIYRF